MAKGQRRSNREVRKPKQVKPKTATATSATAPTGMNEILKRAKPPKRQGH